MPLKPFILFTALACSAAQAQEPRGVPRVLLDRELHERAVQLTGLDGGTILYTDAGGLPRNEAVSEYIAIMPPLQARAPDPPAARRPKSPDLVPARAWTTIELTDGERFFGDIAQSRPSKDSVRWAHPTLGVIEFKLDQVRRIRLDTPPEGTWAPPGGAATIPESDVVLLSNGDRLRGFVESVGGEPRDLSLGPVEKGEPRTINLDVVREVLFANPAQGAPSRSTMVWLTDGSVIACRDVKTSRLGELNLKPSLQDSEATPADGGADAKPAGILKLEDLLGVEFAPGSIAPLCSIPPAEQSPTGDRRWARPIAVADADRAVLGAGDIELPGPLRVEWELPTGAARIAADAELPRQMWTWGECSVVLAAKDAAGAERELAREALSAEKPQVRLAASLAGAKRLVIRVEPGRFGGVQNRVILRRPVLLIDKK